MTNNYHLLLVIILTAYVYFVDFGVTDALSPTQNPFNRGNTGPPPNNGGTRLPGNGGTQLPGNGGTRLPGNGGTQLPGNGGTRLPGNGASQQCEDSSEPVMVYRSTMVCSDMVKYKKHMCYDLTLRQKCCKSCESVKSETPGCEYGNRTPRYCTSSEQGVCTRDDYRIHCCEKCKKYTEARYCADKLNQLTVGSNTMSCPEMAERETRYCYKGDYKHLCCASCDSKKTNVPGCEYGDKDIIWCNVRKPRECYYDSCKDTCCKTCAGFHTGLPGCEYGDRAPWCSDIKLEKCKSSPYVKKECCQTCW